MPSVVFIVLAVTFGAFGFFAGSGLVGSLELLRARPRYLLTAGAAAVLAGIGLGHGLDQQPLLYFPTIFLMMAGVGLASAGWQAEKEWQADRAEVHELRMAQIRRQLSDRRKLTGFPAQEFPEVPAHGDPPPTSFQNGD